jgi:hypothetical protein
MQLTGHDEEEDTAVYRSGSSKTSQAKERPESSGAPASNNVDEDADDADEDGTLFTWQHEGVLRFVKDVSQAAALRMRHLQRVRSWYGGRGRG